MTTGTRLYTYIHEPVMTNNNDTSQNDKMATQGAVQARRSADFNQDYMIFANYLNPTPPIPPKISHRIWTIHRNDPGGRPKVVKLT